MRVNVDHYVDASDPDADGLHDWYYEYDIYRFSQAGRSFVARAYTDEPRKVAFLAHEVKILGFRRHRLLNSADLRSSLFVAALAHFRRLGMTSIDRLTEAGYVPVENAAPDGVIQNL
ncbi:hypothetical protein [Sphingopyxis sp.]|uniref:hypothetical protein n=1 Tax=Sphingopyxis sp. TaxID=1908224 RepID=UPI002C314BA0|nr:hypothetical protein [Sphingopyxis sp.]